MIGRLRDLPRHLNPYADAKSLEDAVRAKLVTDPSLLNIEVRVEDDYSEEVEDAKNVYFAISRAEFPESAEMAFSYLQVSEDDRLIWHVCSECNDYKPIGDFVELSRAVAAVEAAMWRNAYQWLREKQDRIKEDGRKLKLALDEFNATVGRIRFS